MLSDENIIFMDFFAVKVDGSDVIAGICKEVFIKRDSRYDITSANFNSEKVHEDDIFFLNNYKKIIIKKRLV